MILMQANKDRFAQLRCDLANNMTKHVDNYPKTTVDATRMLNEYKSVKTRARNGGDADNGGLAFAQGGGTPTDTITCHHCGKKDTTSPAAPICVPRSKECRIGAKGANQLRVPPRPKSRAYVSKRRRSVLGWLRSKECGAS